MSSAAAAPAGPPLTIVMYHYVRPLAQTAYPRIKGLDLALFEEQLAYLRRHYTPVDIETVIAAAQGETELPTGALLLTFDDGYRDHHAHVFPRLADAGISGAFYPPAATAIDREILDVNRVHFILAAATELGEVRAALDAEIRAAIADGSDAPTPEALSAAHEHAYGYDTAETIYVKRVLQHALPAPLRARIAEALFARFVTADPASFAEELYCGVPELAEMSAGGQHIGLHGDRHPWLSTLDEPAQRADITGGLRLLEALRLPTESFTFCYPYGDHDARTRQLLTELGCTLALTTEVALAHPSPATALTLPRLDTNHLPKAHTAPPSDWTLKARAPVPKAE